MWLCSCKHAIYPRHHAPCTLCKQGFLQTYCNIGGLENWRFSSTFSQDEVAWFQVIISTYHIDKNWQHIFLLSLYTLYFSSWVYCKIVLHNKCFIKLRSWIFVWALLYMYIVPLPLLSACTNMFCVNIRSRNQDHFNTRHIYSLNHWSHPVSRSNGSKQCSCGEACRL